MKSIAIIPARYNSSRFPGKPLADIRGTSMVMRVYEQVMKCSALSTVVVATDDARIFDHVTDQGGNAVMTSVEHKSGTERCAEVLDKADEQYDVVVNVQGDEPMIQPEQIDLLLSGFSGPSTEIVTLVNKISLDDDTIADFNNMNTVKVVLDNQYHALYFSRSPIPFPRNSQGFFSRHVGLYAYRCEILREIVKLRPSYLELSESLEQLRWLENGYCIKVIESDYVSIAIDTPADLEKLKSLSGN